jgi:hypothetical protein
VIDDTNGRKSHIVMTLHCCFDIADAKIHIAVAQCVLDTANDINEIVVTSISVASSLIHDIPVEAYIELHDLCLAYFQMLKTVLENRSRFPFSCLKTGFFNALTHSHVLARLYVAFVIASASAEIADLRLILLMLPSVNHPLRGLLLRLSIIALFPRHSELRNEFALANVNEMIYLFSVFAVRYPHAIRIGKGWITTAVSLSYLSLITTHLKVIMNYFLSLYSYAETS